MLPARALPSPRMHWRNRRRVRRCTSGRSHYNYYRDYDPATGRYVESDPLGLKAGVNTYAYVKDAPLTYSDPNGMDPDPYSHIQCDGKGNYEVINIDKNKCTAGCTQAHEESHIADMKAKFGADSCRNKPRGYSPASMPGYTWQFNWQSECKAYNVQKDCLNKLMNDCSCKDAAQKAMQGTNSQIRWYCNGTPVTPDPR